MSGYDVTVVFATGIYNLHWVQSFNPLQILYGDRKAPFTYETGIQPDTLLATYIWYIMKIF